MSKLELKGNNNSVQRTIEFNCINTAEINHTIEFIVTSNNSWSLVTLEDSIQLIWLSLRWPVFIVFCVVSHIIIIYNLFMMPCLFFEQENILFFS